MMKSKFFLKRLVLGGNNKKNAILNFEEGLNVIAGASDTGKSFAFDCINYGFGSSNVPALPPEAKGYNSVYLEIETLNNDVFTIRRDFNDKNKNFVGDGVIFDSLYPENIRIGIHITITKR